MIEFDERLRKIEEKLRGKVFREVLLERKFGLECTVAISRLVILRPKQGKESEMRVDRLGTFTKLEITPTAPSAR